MAIKKKKIETDGTKNRVAPKFKGMLRSDEAGFMRLDLSGSRYTQITRPLRGGLRKKPIPFFLKFLDYPAPLSPRFMNFGNTRDFLFLPDILSTKRHLYAETIWLLAFLSSGVILGLYFFKAVFNVPPFMVVSGIVAFYYFAIMVFKLYVVFRSLEVPFLNVSQKKLESLRDEDLPIYTILIPLRQEAEVIGQIIDAMTAIDYPPEKLDVIITLEEYDFETIDAIKRANPPAHFKTLILPNVSPKTKPKALNVAFLKTKGEFIVIYDAEIVPDPMQLKKAVIAFREHPELGSLQTRLDHYNANQNIITRLFNSEFSFYYDLFLPGLQKLGFPIPLSGHSTHFRREVIEKIGAWDPYNVAEDCDIGIRMYRAGARAAVLDSGSQEEATSSLGSWIRQRTRWMKGFIQTSIVHLRHPFHFKKEVGGWKNFFAFMLIVPGTVVVNFFNLFYWLMLGAWLAFHPPFIQAFFPGPILFVSIVSFISGNLIFTYLNLVGTYKRNRPSLVKYIVLSPAYWILLAIATVRAVFQIIVNPFKWEKTTHGSHLPEPIPAK
jgi:cellulose synthase/poly-beta-1,6-N-acetylglucosamine synthase-like glycosyltransferase